MDKVRKILLLIYTCVMVLTVAFVVACETDLLTLDFVPDPNAESEFVSVAIMELATLVLVPLSLYFFKIKRVAKDMTEPRGYLGMAIARMMMLGFPLIINTLFYYVYLNPSFGYLAIIIFICMLFFIFPSKARCEEEIRKAKEETQA